MRSPDAEDIDGFFAAVVMPKLLKCAESQEFGSSASKWWTRFVGASSSEERLEMLHEKSCGLVKLTLKVDLLAALIAAGWIDRESGYRELALISLSDIGQLTRCAQEVVIGAKHVVEDLNDDLEFGLQDEALDHDLGSLQRQSVERYCGPIVA